VLVLALIGIVLVVGSILYAQAKGGVTAAAVSDGHRNDRRF
jgi:hypothetical protein